MDTREVQAALVALGCSLVVDGKPGQVTKAAIQAFQVSHGLHVDGIVGSQTIAALTAVVSGKPQGLSVFDRAKLFAYLRSGNAPMFGSSLSSGQVRGIEGILDGFAKTGDGRD
ncbi:peptidoglycan-binding domain-containing protein [Bosea thiooxidans]